MAGRPRAFRGPWSRRRVEQAPLGPSRVPVGQDPFQLAPPSPPSAVPSTVQGTPAESPTSPPAVPSTRETPAQSKARREALEFLESGAFSRSQLIEQLKAERISRVNATFGVDALGVDWGEQAILAAREYLESETMSRTELIEQLEYDGFTSEQAQRAAAHVLR